MDFVGPTHECGEEPLPNGRQAEWRREKRTHILPGSGHDPRLLTSTLSGLVRESPEYWVSSRPWCTVVVSRFAPGSGSPSLSALDTRPPTVRRTPHP